MKAHALPEQSTQVRQQSQGEKAAMATNNAMTLATQKCQRRRKEEEKEPVHCRISVTDVDS